MSPSSHSARKHRDRASAVPRWQFLIIWGAWHTNLRTRASISSVVKLVRYFVFATRLHGFTAHAYQNTMLLIPMKNAAIS